MAPDSKPDQGSSQRHIVDATPALRSLSSRAFPLPALALDTEFERTRTFHARLALLQLHDGDAAHLIDPLAVDDLHPLAELFVNYRGVVVMHAPGEDLEVLERAVGERPRQLFDTQTAAALCGLGWGLGYHRLVAQMFDIEVNKDATRSDWLRRPLSAVQLRYAAIDVEYLLPAYEQLDATLVRSGRRDWLDEEMAHLMRRVREPEATRDFAKLARKIGPNDTVLSRAHDLCHWREAQARRHNLPRRRVLDDANIIDLAQSPPTDVASLRERVPTMKKDFDLAALFDATRGIHGPASRPPEAEDLRHHRNTLSRMKSAVAAVAQQLQIAEELLAPKRMLEQLLVSTLIQNAEVPPEFRGWREEVVLPQLLQLLTRPS